MASGVRLTTQGGPLPAPTASSTTVATARKNSIGSGFAEFRPIYGLTQLQLFAGLRHWIFEPAGAVEQDLLAVWAAPPVRERFFVSRVGGRGFRTEQQPFFGRNLAPCGGDRIVCDRDRKPTAFAHRTQDQKVADRPGHADPGRESLGVL